MTHTEHNKLYFYGDYSRNNSYLVGCKFTPERKITITGTGTITGTTYDQY